MIVFYNGLELRLVRTLNFERQPVLSDDGTSYLFTKFTLNAVGMINSQLDPVRGVGLGTSYTRDASGNIINAVEPFTNEVLTDIVIRHRFSVPRGYLTISTSAGQLLLQSPAPGAVCDCKNGPFPEAFSVKEVFGDVRLFMVHFQITTYVNECQGETGKGYPFLANRFSQEHQIDEDSFLTIITKGTAYFRTDAIQTYGINPDVYRPLLFLPIPVGFKREVIQVSAPSDGGRMDYITVDKQKSDQFVLGQQTGATRIEVNYKEMIINDDGLVDSVLSTMREFKPKEPTPSKEKDVDRGGFGSSSKVIRPRMKKMGSKPKVTKPIVVP